METTELVEFLLGLHADFFVDVHSLDDKGLVMFLMKTEKIFEEMGKRICISPRAMDVKGLRGYRYVLKYCDGMESAEEIFTRVMAERKTRPIVVLSSDTALLRDLNRLNRMETVRGRAVYTGTIRWNGNVVLNDACLMGSIGARHAGETVRRYLFE